VGVETVQNYVHYLESCFVVHRLRRNDLKGKRIMEVNEKLFIGDLGLQNAVLENVISLELRRRRFQVTVKILGEMGLHTIIGPSGY